MFSTPMFSTLESTWDQSAHRGWTTLASFTMQALALSLLFAISSIWVGRPPQVRWLQIATPAAFTPPATEPARGHNTATAVSNPNREQIITPPSIPRQIAAVNDAAVNETDSVPPAPDLPTSGFGSGHGRRDGVPHGLGENIPVVIPAHPTVVKPPGSIGPRGGQPPAPGAADLSVNCAPGAHSGRGRVAGDHQ